MSDIWKGTISAILGAIVAGCANYFITIKNIEFNKQDSEYKQLFPLKFKAYNDLKKSMSDLELFVFAVKKLDQNITDYETYQNNFVTSLVEIETLINNTFYLRKAKLINQNNTNHIFLLSNQWLVIYNKILQLTFGKVPTQKNQEFALEEIQTQLVVAMVHYQDYLYKVLFNDKSYNAQEMKNILNELNTILAKVDTYCSFFPSSPLNLRLNMP